MGDHRASIKCEVEMHGVKRKCDMWINWNWDGGEAYRVDDRVIEFFRNWADEAREAWDRGEYKRTEAERAAAERGVELAELARLKEKYPDS